MSSKKLDELCEGRSIFSYSEEEQRNILRKAIDACVNEYEEGIEKNEGKILFKKPPEELFKPLKEAVDYCYIIGDEKEMKKYLQILENELGIKRGLPPSIAYNIRVADLEENKYTFEERCKHILNGEGPLLFSEKDKLPEKTDTK
ncbi:MAG: hypothetical protein J7L08_03380 [Candidatus Aenigmarchaeota archaeon]|nr:hypothetical protein [Candidatus Aenigmarchaeota archaeon]